MQKEKHIPTISMVLWSTQSEADLSLIHIYEPKGAKIKGSNIYTVDRGPKTIGAKVSDDKKKSYRCLLYTSTTSKSTRCNT